MTESREDFLDFDYVASEGELEEQVVGICAEALGVTGSAEPTASMASVQGSLQAVRICTRINWLTARSK
jgi:hypothetical protein